MLSAEEIQRAIDHDLPVQWRAGGTTYTGKLRRSSSQVLLFEGSGERRLGTDSINGTPEPRDLTFHEDSVASSRRSPQ